MLIVNTQTDGVFRIRKLSKNMQEIGTKWMQIFTEQWSSNSSCVAKVSSETRPRDKRQSFMGNLGRDRTVAKEKWRSVGL